MTDTEVILAAADLIERNGLHKGDYWPGAQDGNPYEPDLPCCVLGALCRVTDSPMDDIVPAERLLWEDITESIAKWSDSHTQAEVVATLRAVATSKET